MIEIAFFDFEIKEKTNKVGDIGCVRFDGATFHGKSIPDFISFVKDCQFLCGHNIIRHDLKYLHNDLLINNLGHIKFIDTLFVSPLLFPAKPYHNLVKDDKLQSEELNNPLNDSFKARDLFNDEIGAFNKLPESLKRIFYLLLGKTREFGSFFEFIGYSYNAPDFVTIVKGHFSNEICEHAPVQEIINNKPIHLAYCLSLIDCKNRYSITPPWVLKSYPDVEQIMRQLRNKPCLSGCAYCNQALDIQKGLKKFFGFDFFRTYAGKPLQREAVKAAVNGKSLLVVFPTGGGKSVTFQLPALMSGENEKGLTVIISPLQSLMKDQIDNLEKVGITEAVTINGLLDPIERGKSFERVQEGLASILYISPEALRSAPIKRLLLGRKICRFVIDEAHCLSSWGQDFRVDYLYIGDFIKSLLEEKKLSELIPVSCFTATAKQKVIEDIQAYFREKLNIDLELYHSNASRTNLNFKVLEKGSDEEKFSAARDLIDEMNCPTIIYVSRTKRAYDIAARLNRDGYNARPYHGKMDVNEKSANQNAFIDGEVQIMVATSAFGMGVDKKNIGLIIHYDISDSLENYIQEAGRAGRDENITAECYVLYNEEDLNKHFILLNQTKLGIKEIKQIWKAIKDLTKFRSTLNNSSLEIARKAGWDDNIIEIENRVTTAIAALEEAGYLKRGQNMPKVFANSILSKNAQEAIDRINQSPRFSEKQKEKAIRIIKKLFSSKSRRHLNEETAESRIDHISYHLGIVREEVISIITLLREEKILADTKDLTAFINKSENKKRPISLINTYVQLENLLLLQIDLQERTLNLKEINEKALQHGINDASPNKIKIILNFWAIKNWIKKQNLNNSNHHLVVISCHPVESLEEKLKKRQALAGFIIDYLFRKSQRDNSTKNEDLPVEFSVLELKDAYAESMQLFKETITVDDIEDALFYLSRIDALKIEGGFLVTYNRLTVERRELDNKVQYKAEDYQKLGRFYENRIQQIHIVGEYAKKMVSDYKGALQFVDDYFQLSYNSFLNRYFPGSRQNEIKKSLTPEKFKKLFTSLSPAQLNIINDKDNKYIVVAAGPGSGKTRVLVHKLASLLLMEDVKHEQLLMVTFSRAAATEFKKRLIELIGNAANYVEIRTFHSYCFDLQGRIGDLERSDSIISSTIEKINQHEVEISRITKTILVIDEAQDMDEKEFTLVNSLMEQNEDMRVIAVGDDDQNIYAFRGSDSKYLEQFLQKYNAVKYELVDNYRSKTNLVQFTNQFAATIQHRLKQTAISAVQTDIGSVEFVTYSDRNLILPLVDDILNKGLSGSTCVLTTTNEEAFLISGLLNSKSLPARLIQDHDGFSLYHLDEIRYFLSVLRSRGDVITIDDQLWSESQKKLKEKYHRSAKLALCLSLLSDFELTNTKSKYISDLEIFIRESKFEDFVYGSSEIVVVSTIHKSKGKEFDNVFLLLANFFLKGDEERRQLYVAMTRAKNNLYIHYNGNYLNDIQVGNLICIHDDKSYPEPDQFMLHLSHEDVNLGYFEYVQHRVNSLVAGDDLQIIDEGCIDINGQQILKFSRKFLDKKADQESKGFRLKAARVNYVVHWKKPEDDKELKIVLPELVFQRC